MYIYISVYVHNHKEEDEFIVVIPWPRDTQVRRLCSVQLLSQLMRALSLSLSIIREIGRLIVSEFCITVQKCLNIFI